MKNSSDTSWDRTSDLPICSTADANSSKYQTSWRSNRRITVVRHSFVGDLTIWVGSGCKKSNTGFELNATWVFKTTSRRDGIWNGLFGEGRRPIIGRDPLLMRKLPLIVELKVETAVIMPELSEPDESAPYFKECYFGVGCNVMSPTMYRSSKRCLLLR